MKAISKRKSKNTLQEKDIMFLEPTAQTYWWVCNNTLISIKITFEKLLPTLLQIIFISR